MEFSMYNQMRDKFSQIWRKATALLIVGLALPAFAALGGDANSVSADAVHMKATSAVQIKRPPTGLYTTHAIQSPHGTVVREFVSPDGRVFGVAWQGPFIPNMQQILGTYFQQYATAARQAKNKQVGRRPLNIHQPGLVVQSSGIMRSYSGRAYAPDLLPQGVSANEIR